MDLYEAVLHWLTYSLPALVKVNEALKINANNSCWFLTIPKTYWKKTV